MSLALIQESAKEVRRLAIAGSPLAVGDFRLKKLIPPLEQAGAKVPVFAQVAKSISDLVNGKEADSANNLLGLSTLLNAILYTQGNSGATGDSKELEIFTTSCTGTKTPARVLKPLVEALTTTGGGRFEIVKSACERGAFNDLRLIDPAIRALDDTYPELADLVAEKILPAYGAGIAPRLKASLDFKGKKADARRLQIMHQVDPAGTLELCKTALETGSPDVKEAAIACLGQHEECLPLVMEQATAKNKTLRAAALDALAGYDRPEVTKLFADMIQGKSLDLLAQPMRAVRSRSVLLSLIEEGKRVFELVLKGDADLMARYSQILDCLVQRKDPEVEEFELTCFSQAEKLAKLKAAPNSAIAGVDLLVHLTTLLYNLDSPKSLEAILARRDMLPVTAFGQVLRSALRTWPADKVFLEFSPLLEQKKGAGKSKAEEIQRLVWIGTQGDISGNHYMHENDSDAQAINKIEWDPRWLDAAITADQKDIVCTLARPSHSGVIAYLLKELESKGQTPPGAIIETLARCEYPKVTDVFLDLVARKPKNAKHYDYELQFLFNCARHLPAADLPKLDAFAPKVDARFLDNYLEALGPLRATPQTN